MKKQSIFFLLLLFLFGCCVCLTAQAATKPVRGVVANPPPLLPREPGVVPNLQGNIDSQGTPLTPLGEESGAAAEAGKAAEIDDAAAATQKPAAPTAAARGRRGSLWSVLAAIFVASVLGALAYGWVRARRAKL